MNMEEAVSRFCDLVENGHGRDRYEFADELKVVLAELLAAAPALDIDDLDDRAPATSARAAGDLQAQLAEIFGERDSYTKVFEPFADEEIVGYTLSLDISAVWADLKPGLACGPEGRFEWAHGYRTHWGKHAVSALYALVHSSYY